MVEFSISGRTAIYVNTATWLSATVAIALRGAAIKKCRRPFQDHDYFIVAAYLFYIAFIVLLMYGIASAGGTFRTSEMTIEEYSNMLKLVYLYSPVFTITITLVKISILLFYRKVFATPRFFVASLVVGGLCVAWFIAFLFLGIFLSWPISSFWTSGDSQVYMIDYSIFMQAYELSNISLDILILALPIWAIWRLQLSIKRKFIIGGTFSLGSLIIVICVFRLLFFNQVRSGAVSDIIFARAFHFTTAELSVAIICACLPVCSPLLKREKATEMESEHFEEKGKRYAFWKSFRSNGSDASQMPSISDKTTRSDNASSAIFRWR